MYMLNKQLTANAACNMCLRFTLRTTVYLGVCIYLEVVVVWIVSSHRMDGTENTSHSFGIYLYNRARMAPRPQ